MLDRTTSMCSKFLYERRVKVDMEHPDVSLHRLCGEVISFMQASGWMTNDGELSLLSTQLQIEAERLHLYRCRQC